MAPSPTEFPTTEVVSTLSVAGFLGAFGWLFRNNAKIAVLERNVALLQEKEAQQEVHLGYQDGRIQEMEVLVAGISEIVKAIPKIVDSLNRIDQSVSFMKGRWQPHRATDEDS